MKKNRKWFRNREHERRLDRAEQIKSEREMTKTEIEMLLQAAIKDHGIVTVEYGHITSRRNGSYGRRRLAAASKLADKGLLQFVTSHHDVIPLSHGFGSDVGTQLVYRITDAGLAKARMG